ncbi:MAG TPA: shikimate kinase [Bacteroidia bacterium]|jgi:shikimate kinase|nr:shikimate kinase [Bacteroidia bacterium]HQF27611.1 shikimate kinase [Bacteroidia bacterium]HQK96879.1 shikimate kinase [Bacteroidia bacterium]
MNSTRIFLIGFMGSGKSSVGKELAKLLKFKFIDLDEVIEKSEKKSIASIFSEFGEHGFRKIEQAALLNLLQHKNILIATGGGCAAFRNNLELMNDAGVTVYLDAHPGTLFHRLAPEKLGRPLIASKGDIDLMEYIIDKLEERIPFYNKAQLKVDAGESIREVARNIEIQLHSQQ